MAAVPGQVGASWSGACGLDDACMRTMAVGLWQIKTVPADFERAIHGWVCGFWGHLCRSRRLSTRRVERHGELTRPSSAFGGRIIYEWGRMRFVAHHIHPIRTRSGGVYAGRVHDPMTIEKRNVPGPVAQAVLAPSLLPIHGSIPL